MDRTPRTFYLLYKLTMAINSRMDEVLRDLGLTVPQYVYLSQIRGHKTLSPSQLSRLNGISPQSISEMIKIFSERGLVKKDISPHSRRSIFLSISKEGTGLLDKCDELMDRLEPLVFSGINTAEHAVVRKALTVMLGNVRHSRREDDTSTAR